MISENTLRLLRRYFDAIESFACTPESFTGLVHPEMRHTEYPNTIRPSPRESTLTTMMQDAVAGKNLLASQRIEMIHSHGNDEILTVEGRWTGVVAEARGPFQPGQELNAWMCMIFELKDGLIWRQRNYDCYGGADEAGGGE